MNTLQYAPAYFPPAGIVWTMFPMAQPTINSVLAELMRRQDINAHQLAAGLAELDPSPLEQKKDFQPTIWRILKVPGYTPTLPTLRVLAAYFDLTVSQLIGETPLDADADANTVLKAMQGMAQYKKTALVSMARTLASDETIPAAPSVATADHPPTEAPTNPPPRHTLGHTLPRAGPRRDTSEDWLIGGPKSPPQKKDDGQ